MATNQNLPAGLRRAGLPERTIQQAPEKFMGAAQEVPRSGVPATVNTPPPAAPSAAPTTAPAAPAPTAGPRGPGAANLSGSGSAPIGNGGLNAAAAPGRVAAVGAAARSRLNSGLGRAVGGAIAVQSIGDSMAEDSTERFARRFGVSEPTGDGSVGDIAKFVGLRAGGFASDLGNNLTGGLAGKYLYQDIQQDAAARPAAVTPAVAAGAAPGAAIAPVALSAGAQQSQTAPAAPLSGTSLRRVDVPGGSPLFTNNPDAPAGRAIGGNLSIAGGGQDQIASMRRAGDLQQEISLMRAGLRDRGNTGAYLGNAGQVASLSAGGASSEVQAQIEKLASKRNLTAAGQNALTNLTEAQNKPAMEAARLAEQARQADQQAQTQTQTSLRSQSTTLRGQTLDAQNAAAKLTRDQVNSDREFGLKTEELGLRRGEAGSKRAGEDFTQRESAEKNLTARFESQFTTTDKDGKQVVDSARVAKYKQGVQQFIGTRQNELQAKVDAGQASAAEKAGLEKLRAKGAAALDEEDLATFQSLMLLGERSEQTAGVFGGEFVQSSNPGDYAVTGRKKNLIGSDTLTLKGGGSVRENDVKYDEAGNIILPNVGKTKTNDFNLARGLKQ